MAYAPIFLTLSVLCVIFYYYLKRSKQFWKRFNVVGPEPDLLFGNYKELIFRRITNPELQEQIYRAYPKEKVVGLYRFNTPMLLLRDLDLIQQVFIRNFDSFVNRGAEFGDKLGDNLAASSDDTWRLLRSRLSPIFTSGKLKNMLYLMERCGDKMLEYLEPKTSTAYECDIISIIKKYTVASISACAFGVDMDLNNPDKKLEQIDKMIFTQYYALELSFICPGLLKKMGVNVVPTVIHDYFVSLVNVIKKQRNGVPSNRKDFMDLLLEMKNMSELRGAQKNNNGEAKVLQITDTLIAAQAMVFYAGGFETSATTVSFLLHELAKHQDIQDKIVAEIKDVLDESNGEINLDTFKKLTYTAQAIDETLRMYAIADLQRKVSAPSCTIPGTNITLKRDDYVVVPTRGIHFDEKYYPDPYKFDPERFSPENVKSRHPCAYMPFGLGPRHCIGMRFAKIQSNIFLMKFLTKYRVEPADCSKEFKFDPWKVTLASKEGVPIKIVRRNM
ncbi:unnamed protein product [Chilo suppressalis]|uniref:unspecific monooxygenase n=1 Tax=Chilo suppressalis TaxID=168631 RepID=A0ABN8B694_CHISP|nr:unnamed protein product [Chilo suppressalis]